MARRIRARKKLSVKSVILSIIFLLVVLAGYYVYTKFFKKEEPFIEAKGAISFHFMMLGNGSSGDSIYIQAGEKDILIDAGSVESSVETIKNYLNTRITDNKIEYVIVTHGDKDHIAGFAKTNGSIFDLYECETIIDFPLTSKSETTASGGVSLYGDYIAERNAEVEKGAKHYTALECFKEQNGAQRVYNLTEDGNVKMEILYNYYYENDRGGDEENDYSVCVQFYHGSKKFLFTGDLEKKGEEKLVEYYTNNYKGTLSNVELFKAGHHGSATSSNDVLLDVIKPKICIVQCAIGDKHDFPRQEFIDRISKHTSNVYVNTMANEEYTNGNSYVDMNGNIVVISDAEDGVYVECSNNNTKLKDTDWFKKYRIWPSYGKA